MKWFTNFMRGRYGVDQLSFAMLFVYFLLTFLGLFIHSKVLPNLALVIMILCWFRMLSKNIYKRQAENTFYLNKTYPIRTWFNKKKTRMANRKVYKYYKCPNCKQELRVPKGKGKITITCPKCHTKFDKRS